MFISTVPLKITFSNEITFENFLKNVSLTQMSIFRHQKYPYAKLLDNLKKSYNFTENLYEVALSYQNARDNNENCSINYESNWAFSGHSSDALQIHFYDMDNTGIIHIYYDYQISKLDLEDIQKLHCRIINLCNLALKQPSILLKDIEIIDNEEKNKIMHVFNQSDLEHPRNVNVYDLIADIAKKFPNHIAVTDSKNSITYQELLKKSDMIAKNLIKHHIQKSDCVGVLFAQKNIQLICSLLGILKAGACFLAIYPDYPDDRISYMFQDSNTKILITDIPSIDFDIPKLYIEDLEEIEDVSFPLASNNDNAYLIYTSGSTGKPKGTVQTHNNLINFVYSFQNFLDSSIGPQDTMLSVTNICFDVSIAEIFTPLVFGATLFLYKDLNTSSPNELAKCIMENHITFSYFPPSMLQSIYEELKNYKDVPLTKLLVGVEPIKASTLQAYLTLNPEMKIINGYGPSETTICCTMYRFDTTLEPDCITPIGSPIGNSKILILDSAKHLVPIGSIGEIYVKGECVGNGYINNSEATQEKFDLENKIYRTGDLAKWLPDGNILFIGRNDDQIKYRGYRIDLGEIEHCIQTLDGIENCTVLLDTQNSVSPILASFIVSKIDSISEDIVRQYLSTRLPHYMIPSQFVFLESLPLTPNGKIDKKALLKQTAYAETPYIAPTTELEKKLSTLWGSVLNKEKVGINDNFFEIGGDSLSAIKIVTLAAQEGLKLSAQNFYTYPTIRLLLKNCLQPQNSNIEKEQNYLTTISNKKDNIEKLSGDILLTGATGFLGAHLLYELLQRTTSTIYCLIRGSSEEHSTIRLKQRLNCYFKNQLDAYFGNRIVVINGDFSKEHLGMKENIYQNLLKKVHVVLNCAAIVKHIGSYDYFYKMNVLSVENLIRFCKEGQSIQLVHISTLSVSGTFCFDQELHHFTEKDLYIGQDINENIYIKTKFEAEQLLARYIQEGGNATIFRLGNITWRSTDGVFQTNENENLFFTLLDFMIETKKLPIACKNLIFNISPVNECAELIIRILLEANRFSIYHIYNLNTFYLDSIVSMLNSLGLSIEFVDSTQIQNVLEKQLVHYPYIVEQLTSSNRTANVIVSSPTTLELIKELNFHWSNIDCNYMKKKLGGIK